MNIETNQILHKDKNKKPILYDCYYKKSKSPKPVIIFCHGYKGLKDWGAWDLMAKTFANEGFFFLKFNFSHNGTTVEQPLDFSDLDAFANNNFTTELDDLDRVINKVTSSTLYAQEADVTKISLIGHSRAGGIVLIKAEEDARIRKVITWAGVSNFKSHFKEGTEAFKQWEDSGVIYVENSRTQQQMPHYFQFYKNFKENEDRLTIKRAVSSLTIPYLILHGDDDHTVNLKEGKLLQSWNKHSTLKVIENGDHVFGASHPWKSSKLPTKLDEVIGITTSFLKK